MSLMRRASLALKALRELGPQSLALYGWYQLGLRSGALQRMTEDRRPSPRSQKQDLLPSSFFFQPFLELPEPESLAAILAEQGAAGLLAEAGEIVGGQVRLFGGPPVPLQFIPPGPLAHWTAYAGRPGERHHGEAESQFPEDIKFTWEPGRFGWAYTLGRAYHLSRDERYPAAFWDYTETFLQANPAYQGPHWVSAQEVALRLMAFTFALQVFTSSDQTTPERAALLARAIATHAARIPPTLAYARAQNNNHLLVEAAGLYTAGCSLPDHPSAGQWKALGWRWLNHALQNQIAADGSYIQHSANYHRLMLQSALWVALLAERQGRPLPEETHAKLAAATAWILALVDPHSGRVPNLGPNDGAYILPLTVCPFHDYRPALQAAAAAFLGERPFDSGPWDEMFLWLQVDGQKVESSRLQVQPATWNLEPSTPNILRAGHSWAYLRVAHFTARPGHSDQLHLDLWWRGLNLAPDAGTYLYNASPPWDNALSRTAAHNTVTVNAQDQMTHAGRFLYLDWAQAEVVTQQRAQDGSWQRLAAQHDGYRRLGITHQRSVECRDENWLVIDRIFQAAGSRMNVKPSTCVRFRTPNLQPVTSTLHWLLPDWPWELRDEAGEGKVELRLLSPHGWISLQVTVGQDCERSGASPLPGDRKEQDAILLHNQDEQDTILLYNQEEQDTERSSASPLLYTIRLVRAGELLSGRGPVSPVSGWVSPTYGVKIPALSLEVEAQGPLPLALASKFIFPRL